MKRQRFFFFLLATFISVKTNAQWQNPNQLSDLNAWPSQSGFMGWYNTGNNVPNSQTYGAGIQLSLPQDSRFGAQIVVPTFENQIYYRRNNAGTWDSWIKVWSSANFNPGEFMGRTTASIRDPGTVNNFLNGYTFAYATSGTPWNGSLISFGGFNGTYDTQVNTDYGPHGGGHMSFRTRQGDIGSWNAWYEVYHSGNLNRGDADFTARTLNAANVYNSGNLWSQQIKVALTNPWADYVFDKSYVLRPLKSLENYIKDHRHLPEMPMATVVEKDRIDVGKTSTLLVKKVEELTLYLIRQNKRMNKLELELRRLKAGPKGEDIPLKSSKTAL